MNLPPETLRLVFREFDAASDGENAYRLNLDPEVLRYTGDQPFASVEDAAHFLRNYPDYRKNGYGRWAVLEKESGEFLGWCGLKRHPDHTIDIGYRFFRKHWGKGYATESAQSCLTYGFEVLGLDEIIAHVERNNIASVRVLEKIGLRYWKDETYDGMGDCLIYRIQNPGQKKSP